MVPKILLAEGTTLESRQTCISIAKWEKSWSTFRLFLLPMNRQARDINIIEQFVMKFHTHARREKDHNLFVLFVWYHSRNFVLLAWLMFNLCNTCCVLLWPDWLSAKLKINSCFHVCSPSCLTFNFWTFWRY